MVWVVWLSLRRASGRHGRFDSKISESANHFRIESHGRFELESNLEASQVPSNQEIMCFFLFVFICALTDNLEQLFTKLKFQVEIYTDLTMDTLEKLLLTVSAIDHSDYDALVCCFMTHGKLGVLLTNDNKPIRILDIVEYFDDLHCESLRGKPKMFFIQACLSGEQLLQTRWAPG